MSDVITKPGNATDAAIGQDVISQIDIPAGDLSTVVNWAIGELEIANRERGTLEDSIAEWERLYEARPKAKIKTFPWYNCSNLVVPVIATAVDSVLSRIMNAVFGEKDMWIGVPKSPEWVELAAPMEDWINWVGTEVMDMYQVCQRWFLGCVKFGTGIIKLPWERRRRNVTYKDGSGTLINEEILVHDGPSPQVVSLADFFWSSDATTTGNFQTCQWIAQRTRLTWKELKEREASGIYLDVERIKSQTRSTPTPLEEEVSRNTGMDIFEFKDYEVFEMYASYDVDGDGNPEEIILTIIPDANISLRAVFNFYRHQERPFHVIRYMPRDNSPIGIGLCQMLEDIQDEVTTLHNQRIDNATLSNTTAFKRRRGALIGEDEVYPGCFIDVDNMDDIDVMEMGRLHPSMISEELHTTTIGEKRSGINDYSVGRESSAIGSRATATSTMALIREGNKRFAMTIRDIRESLNNIGHQTIMLYQQFAPENKVMYELFNEKDKQIVQQFFTLPAEYSRKAVLLDVPALSESQNKEIVRQTLLTLMGVVQNFYGGMFQAFQIALQEEAPQPIRDLAAQGAKAGAKIWERVLEAFDFVDAETFVPDVDTLLQLSSFVEGQNEQFGQNTGRPPNPAGDGVEQALGPIGPGNPQSPGVSPAPNPGGIPGGGPTPGPGVLGVG